MKTALYNSYNLATIYSNDFKNIRQYYKLGSYIVYHRYINQDVRKGIGKYFFFF